MARGGGRGRFQISLRASERRVLTRAARSQAVPHRQVVRARIVLGAAAGLPTALIARRLYLSRPTVAHHVAHVLAKLGFASRAQIAAWVAGQPNSGG